MKIRKEDKVKIIAGKDAGKVGKVLVILPKRDRLVIEGVNVVKRHVKPGVISKEGGIVSMERPIHVSNVMFFDEKSNQPVRVGYKIIDGKKYRVNKKTGDVLDKKI